MPGVSVIVPNYNHGRFLRQRIDTILAQSFQDFELILLDDCSTDDSRSILSSYGSDARVRLDFNPANSGSAFKQWNKGVSLARGEYIWIAESDDYADPRLLERLVAILQADPEIAYAYCRSWRVSADDELDGFAASSYRDGVRWTKDFVVDGRGECRTSFILCNPVVNASAVVFRKFAYERVGGADEHLRLCGDWKLWAAMALGGKVAYSAEPLNYFRFHDASIRKTSEAGSADLIEILQVVRWLLERVTPAESALRTFRADASAVWVPLVMSPRVPLRIKRAIFQNVKGIYPHPLASAIPAALTAVKLKLRRHWRELSPAAGNPARQMRSGG